MDRLHPYGYFLVMTIPLLSACQTQNRPMLPWHTPPDRWKQPRIFHSAFEKELESRIRLSKGRWPDDKKEAIFSPNQAYRYWTDSPDFTKEGPWNTKIYIDNERGSALVIELRDHAPWEPQVTWINEKLVYISVWWGRILGSYFILDVEQEKIIVKEMIRDGQIAYQQYQQAGQPQPGERQP